MEINLRGLFHEFNASKFIVYILLLCFALLISLRQDGIIDCGYYWIFLPLFLWKAISVVGATVGCVVHCRHPPENDANSELEYRAMVLCMTENLLLLMFEVLVCFKLQTDTSIYWSLIFLPLFITSLLCIVVCIWSIKREKNFEFELFFGVNILQFAFIALRVDNFVVWSWVVVFVPLWMVICLSLIAVVYAVILSLLMLRAHEIPQSRRQHIISAVAYVFLVIPALIFLVLLTKKLDGQSDLPYLIVCMPLYISLVCLLLMTFGARSGNYWWFGLRTDFCSWLLAVLPGLRLYGNISYTFDSDHSDGTSDENSVEQQQQQHVVVNNNNREYITGRRRTAEAELLRNKLDIGVLPSSDSKAILPILSIEMPD